MTEKETREEISYNEFLLVVNHLMCAYESELEQLESELSKTAWAMDHDMIVRFYSNIETGATTYEIQQKPDMGYGV